MTKVFRRSIVIKNSAVHSI